MVIKKQEKMVKKEIIVSWFPNIWLTNDPVQRPLYELLDEIKSGDKGLKDIVKAIRKEKDHNIQNKLKKLRLPYFTTSGLFTKREDNALIEMNPIICLDCDNVAELDKEIDRVKQYPYVLAIFLSPTGTGFKALVLHDLTDPKRHNDLYHYLGSVMGLAGRNDLKFDLSCANISRPCFMSYSPQIYINKNAETYHVDTNTLPTVRDNSVKTKRTLADKNDNQAEVPVLVDDAVIRETILNTHEFFERYYSMLEGKRNTNLFILASFFKDNGIPQVQATDYLTAYYVDSNNGFTADEIKKTVNSAYNNN